MASFAESPSRATKETAETSTRAPPVDEDDLDPAAFLQSVRELSAKREREDNERFRKLEEDIERGRQERLARRAEYSRSISPEKHDSRPSRTTSQAPPSTARTLPTPSSVTTSIETSTRSTSVEEVPEFTGFGSTKHSSPMTTPTKQAAAASPTPTSKPSPSAAMPSRSGTLKWQQRPQSRSGPSRPLSMVAAENSAHSRNTSADIEPSRDQIAASLGSRDPSWFRQTADRGLGNAAFRKSTDVDTSEVVSQRKGLPGMTDAPAARVTSTSTIASLPYSVTSESQTVDTSLVESETSTATSHSDMSNRSTSTVQGRLTRGFDSPSPTKEMGGFVQSAMMKRSNSITKRSVGQYAGGLDRASSIRSGYGGLQGSYSMPKLDQPTTASTDATDSLLRPLSSINLAKPDAARPSGHSRSKSITSAYTTNDNDNAASLPPSPSKRWSPNKSSWIDKALTAKPESRPASPTKNSQPAWMSNLAKANAQRANAETEPVHIGVHEPAKTSTPKPDQLQSSPVVKSPTHNVEHLSTVIKSPEADAAPSSTTFRSLDAKTVPRPAPIRSPKPDFVAQAAPSPRVGAERAEQPLIKSPTPEPAQRQIYAEPESLPIASRPTSHTGSTTSPRTKPQPSPKPQIDFRSNLKPRAATDPKAQEQPEFLSRFGTLRKTVTERYIAPDLLKDNILRGKAGLAVTDGPQKRERQDELKESLLAKKDQWRQEKQDGVVHEHKSTVPPVTPSKPEALVKRDLLGRSGTVKALDNLAKDKPTTPEALRRHQSMRHKPSVSTSASQDGTSIVMDTDKNDTPPPVSETSKLAARFNPGLASIFARGPQATPNKRDLEQVPSSLVTIELSEPSDQLTDMRKGRAKGPKRRKAGASTEATRSQTKQTSVSMDSAGAPPRSAATLSTSIDDSPQATKPAISPKPASMQNDRPVLGWNATQPLRDIPEFKGFSKTVVVDLPNSDNKENDRSEERVTGSKPSPIQVLSKKDEEAAMRSAKLLASNSPTISKSPNGLGISGPPRPTKSSRVVSGQLQEASLNKVSRSKGLLDAPHTGSVLQKIDARAVLAHSPTPSDGRTIRKALYRLDARSRLEMVSPRDEYTLYEDGVYLLRHVQAVRGTTTIDHFIWVGRSALSEASDMMKAASKVLIGARTPVVIRQTYETQEFLRAAGGIMITRRSSSTVEPYMLRGRKHLGHIVFDELDCRPASLCSAFVYLTWSPRGIDRGTMHLWKGSFCSAEEVGAARLAAMDLIEDGDIAEVDEGMEPTSFWKLFSAWPIREDVPPCPESLKERGALRLFKIQKQVHKQSFFTHILSRRPSWGSRSPAPGDVRFEAKELSPFGQEDLDAEGIYLLDGGSQLDILVGPLSAPRDATYLQALYLADDYAALCADERRTAKPDVNVVFHGIPAHIPYLFRHWDEERGLWSTAGLMAGSVQQDLTCLSLRDALAAAAAQTQRWPC